MLAFAFAATVALVFSLFALVFVLGFLVLALVLAAALMLAVLMLDSGRFVDVFVGCVRCLRFH